MKEIKITEAHESLNEYYGHVNSAFLTECGKELIEIHHSDGVEWECGSWFLDGELICVCDGVYGRSWEESFDSFPKELQAELLDTVTSYEICGLLEEAMADDREEVTEDDEYEGEVMLEASHNFYNSRWKNRPTLVTSIDYETPGYGGNEPYIFEFFTEAKEYLDELESRTYYLSNGEYARPDYRIVKA